MKNLSDLTRNRPPRFTLRLQTDLPQDKLQNARELLEDATRINAPMGIINNIVYWIQELDK